jgi:hypothetical protein
VDGRVDGVAGARVRGPPVHRPLGLAPAQRRAVGAARHVERGELLGTCGVW